MRRILPAGYLHELLVLWQAMNKSGSQKVFPRRIFATDETEKQPVGSKNRPAVWVASNRQDKNWFTLGELKTFWLDAGRYPGKISRISDEIDNPP